MADALYYLDKKKIMDCDTVKMKEAFSKAKEAPFTVKVSDAGALESREFGIYTMSSDLMEMEAVFYPPFEGAGMLDEDELSRYPASGRENGIKTDVVKIFWHTAVTDTVM